MAANKLSWLLLSVCFAVNAQNEDGQDDFLDFYGDEEFVSIATGTSKNLRRLPAVATVITADQVRLMGANTLFEILETVSGIHVYPSITGRTYPTLSVRGLHTGSTAQTLMLLNGVRTTELYTGGAFNLFDLNVEIIERIEVIKGPGSAVYGADAFAAVINVITKGDSTDIGTEVGVKAGAFGTRSGWLNTQHSIDETKFTFNASWRDFDGDNQRVIERDGLFALGLGNISLAPRALDSRRRQSSLMAKVESKQWYGSLWHQNSEGGTGTGVSQVLSDEDRGDTRVTIAKAGYRAQTDAVDTDISVHYIDNQVRTFVKVFPEGFVLPTAFDGQTGAPTNFTLFPEGFVSEPGFDEDTLGIEYVGIYKGLQGHRVRWSSGYDRSELTAVETRNYGIGVLDGTEQVVGRNLVDVTDTDFIFIQPQSRNLYYASLQDEWQLAPDWELTLGLRYDHYSDFGSTTNPRVALVWQVDYGLTMKALYGEAFRAPSFRELYNINNPATLGNPDLSPENIRYYELVIDYQWDFSTRAVLNLFRYDAEDLISFVDRGRGAVVAENADEVRSTGFEIEVEHQFSPALSVKGAFAWHDAENVVLSQAVADAPRHVWDISMEWQITPELYAYADTRWIRDRARPATDPRPVLSNYHWTNVALSYQFHPKWRLELTLRNLLDQDAFEASSPSIPGDLPLERRGYWLSVAVELD